MRPIPPIPKPMPPGARRRPFPLKSCASNCLQPAMRPKSHAICKRRRPSGPHGGVPHIHAGWDAIPHSIPYRRRPESTPAWAFAGMASHKRAHVRTHAACAYKHACTRTQTHAQMRVSVQACTRAHTGCRPYTSIISWKGFMRLSAPSPLRGKSSWYLTTSMQPTKLYLPDRTHLWNVPAAEPTLLSSS